MPKSDNRRKKEKRPGRQKSKSTRSQPSSQRMGEEMPKRDNHLAPSVKMSLPQLHIQYPVDHAGVGSNMDDEAIFERVDDIVNFEMTEFHYRNIGLDQVDFFGEIGGGDIDGPDIATVSIHPLENIQGHPRWQTGADAIAELSNDPNIFRDEFAGNRWQGSGAP